MFNTDDGPGPAFADTDFRAALRTALAQLKLAITNDQEDALAAHYQRMVEVNREVNLTRIIEPARAAVLHYADSLALLKWAETIDAPIRSVLDIGSGAGFPAFPIAVCRPEWTVTAIESTRKKLDFLSAVVEQTGLSNLRLSHAHSDHWDSADRFTVVTGRAIGKLADFIASARRFVEPGGWVVSFKTARMEDAERRAADHGGASTRLIAQPPFEYVLHDSAGDRHMMLDVRRFVPRGPRPAARACGSRD